jgi:hypothetical protein
MSKVKITLVIISVQILLLAIGYVSASTRIPSDTDDGSYAAAYMMGYSLPVVAVGVFVFWLSRLSTGSRRKSCGK